MGNLLVKSAFSASKLVNGPLVEILQFRKSSALCALLC